MRVSACGDVALTLEEALELAKKSAEVTHNHPEGIKGAQATAGAIFLARNGKSKEEIKEYIEKNFYTLDKTLDEIRPEYRFNETCQGTVPQAIQAFLESTDFEDAIRNAISLGGDSDTLAAITGGIAEAYYGISDEIRDSVYKYLPDEFVCICNEFESYCAYLRRLDAKMTVHKGEFKIIGPDDTFSPKEHVEKIMQKILEYEKMEEESKK
jgi:ADP-ribosylglycohydrolase